VEGGKNIHGAPHFQNHWTVTGQLSSWDLLNEGIFSLFFFSFSETWLIFGKFSLKETHSWYGNAAVRALRHYFLKVKCSWVFLWNVTLAFLCVGGKKSFFFTPVGLDIVYSKSGIRNNSCHIYIQMTFKRSYFIVWAPIPMQFHQVYSLQSGMLAAQAILCQEWKKKCNCNAIFCLEATI